MPSPPWPDPGHSSWPRLSPETAGRWTTLRLCCTEFKALVRSFDYDCLAAFRANARARASAALGMPLACDGCHWHAAHRPEVSLLHLCALVSTGGHRRAMLLRHGHVALGAGRGEAGLGSGQGRYIMCTAAAREAGRNDSVPLLALCRCVPGRSTIDQYGADRWRSTGHRKSNGEVSCNQQLPARCFSSWSRS